MGKLRPTALILGEGPTEFFYFKSLCDVSSKYYQPVELVNILWEVGRKYGRKQCKKQDKQEHRKNNMTYSSSSILSLTTNRNNV